VSDHGQKRAQGSFIRVWRPRVQFVLTRLRCHIRPWTCSAKQIKNKAVVNEDPNEKLIKGAWRIAQAPVVPFCGLG